VAAALKASSRKRIKVMRYTLLSLANTSWKTNSIALKSLREDLPQQTLYHDELAEYLKLKVIKK